MAAFDDDPVFAPKPKAPVAHEIGQNIDDLSAPELADPRLPGFGAPGLGRFSVQSSRRTHAQRLGRGKITGVVNRAVGKTLTLFLAKHSSRHE